MMPPITLCLDRGRSLAIRLSPYISRNRADHCSPRSATRRLAMRAISSAATSRNSRIALRGAHPGCSTHNSPTICRPIPISCVSSGVFSSFRVVANATRTLYVSSSGVSHPLSTNCLSAQPLSGSSSSTCERGGIGSSARVGLRCRRGAADSILCYNSLKKKLIRRNHSCKSLHHNNHLRTGSLRHQRSMSLNNHRYLCLSHQSIRHRTNFLGPCRYPSSLPCLFRPLLSIPIAGKPSGALLCVQLAWLLSSSCSSL